MSLAAGSRTIRTVLDVDANPLVRGFARAEQAARSTADAMRRGGEVIRRTTAGYATDAKNTEGALVRLGRAAEQNSREFTQAGMAITAAGALITGATVASAKAAIDWESAWISVRKVLSGSPEEFAALEGELRELARTLPSSHQEIAAVAETAARLGVATGDVTAFTRTMIDMGETTTLSAEEAANGIARFSNVMGTATDDAGRVGSAIVDLGNNFATTETEILNMAQRLAAASNVAGLTEAEVLGLSAAMSEVGINAEAGGTAMSRVIMRISSAVEEGGGKLRSFADIAGMSSAEFSEAWANRPVEALMAVVGGLGEMTATGEGTFGMLEELGLQDVRVANMMLSLAGNAEGAARAVQTSTQAWEENVALTREAEQRYASVESQIKMAWASIQDAAITMGQTFLPVIVEVADMAAQTANAFAGLSPEMAAVVGWTGALAGGLGLVAGGLLLVTPRAVETYRAFQALGIIGPRTSAAIRGVATFLGGPWGVAIAGAVIATGLFIREHQKKKQAIEEVRQTLDDETGALTENTRAWAAKAAQDEGALEWADRLGLAQGTVTDALMGQPEALEAVRVATERANADVLKHSDAWGEVDKKYSEAADAGRRLNDFLSGNADVISEAQTAQERLNAEMESGARTAEHLAVETQRLTAQAEAYLASQEGVNAAVRDWLPAAERAAALGEEAAEAYYKWQTEMAGFSESFVSMSGALQAANQASQEWAQEQADATKSADDSWQDFWDGQTLNVDAYIAELERMVQAQADWETNMVLLSGRVSQGVLDELARMGPEGAVLAQALIDDTTGVLAGQMEAAFGDEARAGSHAFAAAMADAAPILRAAAAMWGQDISDEIAAKLASGEMTAAEVVAAYDLATTIDIQGDPAHFDENLALSLAIGNGSEATAGINGNPSGFEDALDASLALGNSETATPDIDGDNDPFIRRLNEALAKADGETGTPKIDGDPALALGKLADLMRTIRGSTGSVRADANTQPGINSVFGLMGWISRQTATLNVVARLRGALDLGAGIGFGNYAGAIHDRGTRTYAAGGIDDRGRYVPRTSQIAGPMFGRRNVLWAEDSTRREAYISDHPAYRDRNIGILEQVASWYGRSLVQAKTYAAGGVAGESWASHRVAAPVMQAAPTVSVPPIDYDRLALAVSNVRFEAKVGEDAVFRAGRKGEQKYGPRAQWGQGGQEQLWRR